MTGTDSSCIILAGGLGTRLRGSIGDIPKCMAPVAGRPFLHHLLRYLERQGVSELIFSLGYRADAVTQWLGTASRPFRIKTVVESEPLGTGGGISLALNACRTASVFVLNGDTFFDVDLESLRAAHIASGAETTLALKYLEQFERYGTVQTAADADCAQIKAFEEKRPMARGLINGGVYCIDREAFLRRSLPERFSFEKDYLEAFVSEGRFAGHRSDGYFIDIGVPDDYQRAQTDFQTLFPA